MKVSPRSLRGGVAVFCAVASLLLISGPARAVDSIEPFGVGLADVEAYVYLDGLGAPAADRWLGVDFVLSAGLVKGLTAYLGAATGTDHLLGYSETALFFALYGTPVDTDHLDLDLIFEVVLGGPGLQQPTFVPGLELNLDREPEQAAWGGFLRLGLPFHGGLDAQSGEPTPELALELEPAVYYSLAGGHQLLMAYRTEIFDPGPEEALAFSSGSLLLGANLLMSDDLELVLEAAVNLPDRGTPMSLGVMVGVLAFLPTPD